MRQNVLRERLTRKRCFWRSYRPNHITNSFRNGNQSRPVTWVTDEIVAYIPGEGSRATRYSAGPSPAEAGSSLSTSDWHAGLKASSTRPALPDRL